LFTLDNGNEQDCRWLTIRPDREDVRTARYCPRIDVKYACKLSCNNCICEDDPDYRFILDNGTEQDCGWFLRNEDKIEVRRERYCLRDVDGQIIGDACPVGCGFCT
jgi:hypothetical protein